MLNLLAKDFKLLFGKNTNTTKRILSTLFTLLFVGAFVAIEVFLYTMILSKIETTKNASSAFTCLFLFVISVIVIVSGLSVSLKISSGFSFLSRFIFGNKAFNLDKSISS